MTALVMWAVGNSVFYIGVVQCQPAPETTSCGTRMTTLYGARKWIQARAMKYPGCLTFTLITPLECAENCPDLADSLI